MKHVFFVGNKRSGTTLLVHLLNLHPNVFILHESDIPWILYQMQGGVHLRGYEWDDEFRLAVSMYSYSHMLDQSDPEASLLYVAEHVMRAGGYGQKPAGKRNLLAIGDKKPYTYADPVVNTWLRDTFEEPTFIHIHRHPWAVVSSMHETGLIDWWGKPIQEVVDGWLLHEQRARDTATISLRYEDLCSDPGGTMERVFDHIGVPQPDEEDHATIVASVWKRTHGRRDLIEGFPYSDELLEVMHGYGYQPGAIPTYG